MPTRDPRLGEWTYSFKERAEIRRKAEQERQQL